MRIPFGVLLASLVVLQIACDRKESSKGQSASSEVVAKNAPTATPELAPDKPPTSYHRAASGESVTVLDSKVDFAKAELANLMTTLDTFEVDNGRYPTNDEGLFALSNQPSNMPTWHGPYVDKPIVNDPWGHPYIYRYPGAHNPRGFDLSSMGKDGKESSDDIKNWKN